MPKLTRRPVFWILHALLFLLCLTYTWRNFNRAFPFVELDVKMDRKGALLAADTLAREHRWAPREASGKRREAVAFDQDSMTQNYIELEAGGPAALSSVLKEGLYSPYTWRVRHFAEGVANETHVRFRPDGTRYGFFEKISEDDPGAALSSDEARAIAERAAVRDWGIELGRYRLVEKSQEVRRSKRVDHSFIYELADRKVGEGRYRLRLGVSGSEFSELARFIKIPDAFYRRYSAMRSSNSTIAAISMAVIAVVYGLLLCGIGLFVLARRHWVQWRMPLAIAGGIAGLQFLDSINQLPLEWMGYDTALSTSAFLLRHVINALVASLFELIVLGVPIMAAESLTRRAFPSHPQLWKVFSKEAAGTPEVLGRVVGAFLFVGYQFAFVVWVYWVGSHYLGWWNPSEVLFHPDALATYLPWLTSVSSSLHAGIWEECLFRAVPLASAALLGARYGRRALWIAIAFVAQAIVFGAAHASYPTQPAYARMVELIVPSFMFGGVYLAFGLLPSMIMHYTYDVVLFAMPLFLSSGASAGFNCALVVALTGLPLWVALAARWRQGKWLELSPALRNGGWAAPVQHPHRVAHHDAGAIEPAPQVLSPWLRKGLIASGAIGLAIWAGAARVQVDAPSLKIGRDQAIATARRVLAERGVKLGAEWRALGSSEGEVGEEDRFVWKTAGKDLYRSLMGSYVEPPQWRVRFARFEGDVVERAEEYQVFLTGTGEVFRVRHELPEARPGAQLSEAAARLIAEKVVRERFGLEPARLRPVSSQQFRLPARLDWLFLWSDPSVNLPAGETRIAVRVAGDEAVGWRRFIDVPEEWLRKERSKKTVLGVARGVSSAFLTAVALGVTFWAVQGWIHHVFSLGAFAWTFLLVLAADLFSMWNGLPAALADFSTAQSVSSQFTRYLARQGISALFMAALPAVWTGYVHGRMRRTARASESERPWAGYAAGAIVAAAMALAQRLGQASSPAWPGLAGAGDYLPAWEGIASVASFLGLGAFLMLLFLELRNRIRSPLWRHVFLAALGIACGALWADRSLSAWVSASAAFTAGLLAMEQLLRRTSAKILVPIVAAANIFVMARGILAPGYPGAISARVIGIACLLAVSWLWFRALEEGGEA